MSDFHYTHNTRKGVVDEQAYISALVSYCSRGSLCSHDFLHWKSSAKHWWNNAHPTPKLDSQNSFIVEHNCSWTPSVTQNIQLPWVLRCCRWTTSLFHLLPSISQQVSDTWRARRICPPTGGLAFVNGLFPKDLCRSRQTVKSQHYAPDLISSSVLLSTVTERAVPPVAPRLFDDAVPLFPEVHVSRVLPKIKH